MPDEQPDLLPKLTAAFAGRYDVERELGRGGMATVYLAHDVKHDREVAIKVLHPELAATVGGDRFEREIRVAAKLQHPHILGMFDSGVADGLLYYVMPFVKGESLRDRIDREGMLPVEDALQITLEVNDALGYAHKQGVVHRDIKPENILLADGHALVADFGIARVVSDSGTERKLTQTGMSMGTAYYMAPEQASGEAVGPTADLYALGCVLYEMLAGEPPFTGKNAMQIMARHAMEQVPSVRIMRNVVPEELENAIFIALNKTPQDRPQSAEQFAQLLGMPIGSTASMRILTPTMQRRIPSGPQRNFAGRHPWWRRPGLIATVIVLVAGAAFGGWRMVTGARLRVAGVGADSLARRVAVLYFTDNSKDGELRPLAGGITEALIRALAEVPALRVVSRNGVAPYRDGETPKDSIARALSAGTLVVGSVEPEGKDRVRLSTRLFDGNGTDLGKRTSITVARDSLFKAADAVAGEVSRTLREWLGQEVQLKESQAGTSSMEAWTHVSHAEKARRDAEPLVVTDRPRAIALYAQADSLLHDAEVADGRWVEPVVLKGELAFQRGRMEKANVDRAQWNTAALQDAARALSLDPSNARALALRGTVVYSQWALNLTTDPVARAAQLDGAQTDLENAVRRDGSLAAAYATLSELYYSKKDRPMAFARARQAYEADAFLSNTSFILYRLFWTSYDTDLFQEAARWCDEARRRFPGELAFTACKLWMLLTPDAKPDVAEAWRLAAEVDSLAPADRKLYQSHLMQFIVGGVIGREARATPAGAMRTALMDSAQRVLVRARADRTVDPKQELVGYEAIMRTQMGQYDEAVSLLRQYVAVNPDHSFKVGGNVHWWWRDLRTVPGFAELLARGR